MSVYTSGAYDFDMFEEREAARPLRTDSPYRKSKLKKVAPKSAADKHAEEQKCIKMSAKLIGIVAVVFVCICLQISAGAERYELIKEIAAVQAEVKIAEAENVRLNSELDGITSVAIIDNYATEILGMSKVEDYQFECLNLAQGDKVIYSAADKGR